jgi:integrase
MKERFLSSAIPPSALRCRFRRGDELCHQETLCTRQPAFRRAPEAQDDAAGRVHTGEEYRKLHTVGRRWIGEADKPSSIWYRTITYNMILIACNTGMRPAEMKNLRWRDIMPAKDREGREIAVLFVQGKGKSRNLVAPKSVGDYLERIHAISKATQPEDRVFTNITVKPAKTLYNSLIADLLNEANLREGTQGRAALDVLLPAHLRHAQVAGRRGRVFPCRADGNFRPHD